MNFKECTQSKMFQRGVIAIGVLLVALVSFASGVAVGLHKARFSYAWGENYEQHFVGGSRGTMRDMMERHEGKGFRNPHGAIGTVVSVTEDAVLIRNQDGQESSVRITDQTTIMKQREKTTRESVVPGVSIAVVGTPNNEGVVEADLIRLFDRNGYRGESGMSSGRGK